jgi:hypothetical protein
VDDGGETRGRGGPPGKTLLQFLDLMLIRNRLPTNRPLPNSWEGD